MALNLEEMSVSELQDLINRANNAKFLAESAQRDEVQLRLERIREANASLQTLLGPVDAQPAMDSIRGVQAYGPEVIAANPGQAAVLLVEGLAQLTATVLDLTKVISEG